MELRDVTPADDGELAYVDAGGIQHAIVTTSDAAVHELWWAPVPPVLLGGVLATG